MKQGKNGKTIFGENHKKVLPRFEYLNNGMTVLELKKFIFDKIKYIFRDGENHF